MGKQGQRELERAATALLKQSGHTASGRQRGAVPREQYIFERRMRPNPFSGRSTRRR